LIAPETAKQGFNQENGPKEVEVILYGQAKIELLTMPLNTRLMDKKR
jgi:hypothetical protein